MAKSNKKSESKGLGDTVAKVTEATGIAKVAKAILGDDCGCDKRQEVLNRLFPYVKKNEFTNQDVEDWKKWQSEFDGEELTVEGQNLIVRLINKLGYAFTACKTCNTSVWLRHIDTINEYVKEVCNG